MASVLTGLSGSDDLFQRRDARNVNQVHRRFG
jgi:hypothetical protein